MALLYASGLTLTLLHVTSLTAYAGMSLMILTVLIAGLAVATLERRAMYLLGGAAAVIGAGFLFLGGIGTIGEVVQAIVLHMSGLTMALPLVAAQTAVIVSVICGAAAFFVTHRSAGAYPALVLLLLTVVLLWLGDQVSALWALLPAVIACVTLLLQASDEAIRTSKVLPLAVVTTVLSFAGVAVGGATIPPLKDAADALRQKINDIFFFTEPRDVFTLATEGYYPQGQAQLGGPAEPHDQPVMAVITPRKTYLRGVVKNVYTGSTWLDTTAGKRYLWGDSRYLTRKDAIFDMSLPDVADLAGTGVLTPYTVTVRMLNDSASSMFVPQRIRGLKPEGDLTPYFNISSEVFATRNLSIGDVWTVEAPLFHAGDTGVEALVNACSASDDPNWDTVARTYLDLPGHLEQAVYDIAHQAVSGAITPYEMAWKLQTYLASSYEYTLDVNYQPPELDFVSNFLLLEKKGYCTYFASAMTVLCRMVGLPARYVEGYLATPDAEGLAIVTGQEGHAWTEVYFRGFGWLTFDATPWSSETVYITPDQLPPEDTNTPEESPEPTATPTVTPTAEDVPTPTPTADDLPTPSPTASESPQQDRSAQDGVQPGKKADFPWLWLLLAALIAAAARIVLTRPAVQARRAKEPFAAWLVWVQAVHDALRMLGLVRLASETPMAFCQRVEAEGKLSISMAELGEAESLMFYGHAVPEQDEIDEARRLYETLRQRLNVGQRALMVVQRAFMPKRSHDITE